MPSVFISYRRSDTAGHAGRLAQELGARYGRERVFIDIDAISPGADFHERIDEAVKTSDVALVLIGDEWLEPSADGSRRIDDERDVVRQEVAAALEEPSLRVVPVLVENARMPAPEELPPDISRLSRLNAFDLSNKRWQYDYGRLLADIEQGAGGMRAIGRRLRSRAGAIAVGAAIVIGGAALAAVLLGGGGGKEVDPATRVDNCKKAHGMRSARQERATREGESEIDPPLNASTNVFRQRTIASCDWPAPVGAEPDGYRAITVTTVEGPGQAEVTGQSLADRFESRCPSLQLEYKYGSMGVFQRLAPFRARQGEMWSYPAAFVAAPFSRISPESLNLPFYPNRSEVVVLHSTRSTLDRVTCRR